MPAMDQTQALLALTDVFRNVFDDPGLELRDGMTAADVENWDSLNHIDLIVAIERKFKIKFTTREVTGLKTVGDLAELTARKVSAVP
jgi:acyl carrier protein